MLYRRWTIFLGAALLGSTAASAIAPQQSLDSLYVRARAAEAAGDTAVANAGFTALMNEAPGNMMIAARAYRQAVAAGDMPLALKAAHVLEARNALPPDGRVLLVIEQIKARDWTKARAAAGRLGEDRVFGFLAPYCQAWIAQGSGAGDPLAIVGSAQALPLAAPYRAEQRNFLLMAMGRSKDIVATPADASAMQVPDRVDGPDRGLAMLLVHVASDFSRQQLTPIGLIMARFASYADPHYAGGWLMSANMLRSMQRADLALAAVARVPADDPLALNARAMRIGLLNDSGKRDAALTEALRAAEASNASADDWGRVGDLYLALARPADAATAYGKALAITESAKGALDDVWPVLLQQGNALDLAGDWPGAKARLARAYAMAPDQAVVLNQYGYSLIDHNEDVPRAGRLIEQASKLRPEDPAITDSLGWVLYLRGQAADAVPLLERAAAGAPGEATINEHLGDVYWALGRQIEARYAWRAALVTAEDKLRARLTAKIDTGPDAANP